MRLRALILVTTLGCARVPHPTSATPVDSCAGIRPASGPFSTQTPLPTANAPSVWLVAESDVLVQGQLPHVDVFARDRGGRQYADTKKFSVLRSDGKSIEGRCDRTRKPGHSRGVAALNFECKPMPDAGTYTIHFEPPQPGMSGAAVDLPIRILKGAPPLAAAPAG